VSVTAGAATLTQDRTELLPRTALAVALASVRAALFLAADRAWNRLRLGNDLPGKALGLFHRRLLLSNSILTYIYSKINNKD